MTARCRSGSAAGLSGGTSPCHPVGAARPSARAANKDVVPSVREQVEPRRLPSTCRCLAGEEGRRDLHI